jgi:hypothetical protein
MARHQGEYVYIIREREHQQSNEQIYKVGFSGNFVMRAKKYPKGSLVISTMRVTSGRSAERAVMACIMNKFKRRKDIGSEYFEIQKPYTLGDFVHLFIATAVRFVDQEVQGGGDDDVVMVEK